VHSLDEVVVIVLDTILAEAVPQSPSKFINLALGFAKRVTILVAMLLAFL
jgi:capsular polysaccharide biosynthesis protein